MHIKATVEHDLPQPSDIPGNYETCYRNYTSCLEISNTEHQITSSQSSCVCVIFTNTVFETSPQMTVTCQTGWTSKARNMTNELYIPKAII